MCTFYREKPDQFQNKIAWLSQQQAHSDRGVTINDLAPRHIRVIATVLFVSVFNFVFSCLLHTLLSHKLCWPVNILYNYNMQMLHI